MDGDAILRFTEDHPCWTVALFERVGEDLSGLDGLERTGLLAREGDALWLTDEGRAAFARLAAELYVPDRPGEVPMDAARSLMATELWLEMERCNAQRGGLKRYLFRPKISVRPALSREDAWAIEAGRIAWRYLDAPTVRDVLAGPPPPTVLERSLDPWRPEALAAWRSLPSEPFVPDVALLVDYDFEHYLGFEGHPGDEMRIINTDRFVFSAASTMEDRLDELGRFHRWLLELRRLRIAGWLDLDFQQQDSVSWLIFLVRSQGEARAVQTEMRALGPALTGPAMPMEVWALSLEAMRECPSGRELVWDVLPDVGLSICPAR